MKHNHFLHSITNIYWLVFFLAFLVCGVFGVQKIQAAPGIRDTINFQGKLVDSSGLNVSNGSYSIEFTLYDSATAGTNLWSETQTVTVTDGIFRVELGTITSISTVDFAQDNIYLALNVNTDGEMSPRIRFTAVPYAFEADSVGVLSADYTNDRIGIGTSSPSTLLQLGEPGTIGGQLSLAGSASGLLTVNVPGSFTAWDFIFPSTPGTNAYLLQTDGTGATSWVDPASFGGSSAGLSGEIQFSDGTGGFVADSQFYWDDTTNQLGIGTSSPIAKLNIEGTTDEVQLLIEGATGQTVNLLEFRDSAGTLLKYFDANGDLTVQDGQYAFRYEFGNYGITFNETSAPFARYAFNNAAGESFIIGGTAPDDSFVLNNSGAIGLGTNTPNAQFNIVPNTPDALRIDAYGTGVGETGEIQFMELATNGSNHVGLKAPDALAGDVVFTLPNADGLNGQVLSTNGSGELSWTTIPAANSPVVGQFYDSTGGTDVNQVADTAIPFDAETRKDTGITHSTTLNTSQVELDDAGWYRVSYSISYDSANNSRKNIRCRIRLNGSTIFTPSESYSYVRNNNNDQGTNTATVIFETTVANEYYEIVCNREGDANSANLIAGESWTTVEKIGGSGSTPPSVVTLDDAYFNDTDKILTVDNASGLSFDSTSTGDITVDLQSTGDFTIQDSGADILNISDIGNVTFTLDATDNPDFVVTNLGTGDFIIEDTTGDGTPFLITSDGQVGIGTDVPANADALLTIGEGAAPGDPDRGNLVVLGTGATCTIGDAVAFFLCTSDESLKKNVENLNTSLDGIMKLRPVTYRWNFESESDPAKIGLIAQEVEEVFPQLVGEVSGGYKAIDYASLAIPLISAVQEQQLIINSMGSELDTIITTIAPEMQAKDSSSLTETFMTKEEVNNILKDYFKKHELNEIAYWNFELWTFLEEVTFKAKVTFEHNVTFISSVIFKDRVIFEDTDMGGYVSFQPGERRKIITFDRPYEFVPVVSINQVIQVSKEEDNPQDYRVDAFISNVSEAGFDIVLVSETPFKAAFSWTAIPIGHSSIDEDLYPSQSSSELKSPSPSYQDKKPLQEAEGSSKQRENEDLLIKKQHNESSTLSEPGTQEEKLPTQQPSPSPEDTINPEPSVVQVKEDVKHGSEEGDLE